MPARSAGNADPLARLERRLRGLGLFALAQQADQRVVDPGRPGAETDEPSRRVERTNAQLVLLPSLPAAQTGSGEHGLNNHHCPLAADFFHRSRRALHGLNQIDEGRLFLPRFGVDQYQAAFSCAFGTLFDACVNRCDLHDF